MPDESRLEHKIDEILKQQMEQVREISRMSERLAIVETLVQERTDDNKEVHDRLKDLEERMGAVEKHKTQVVSFKEIAMGGALLGLAIWEAMK